MPVLNATGVNVVEGNASFQSAVFTVFLDEVPTAPVTVNYHLQDGTASTRLGDYTAVNGTLTFAAGQQSRTLSFQVFGDTAIEGDETFQLILTDVTGATFAGNASALVADAVIYDNDGGAPNGTAGTGATASQVFGPGSASAFLPTLRVQDVGHIEGNSSWDYAYFLITLDEAPTAPISVNYHLQDGTASARQGDYTPVNGTATFAAGQTSSWLRIQVFGDTANEGNETFDLVLTDIVGAVFENNASALVATGTIINDDGGAPTLAGGIGGAGDGVFGPASASAFLPTLRVQDVQHIEGNDSWDYAYFLVTLDEAPTAPISVNYHLQDGTASARLGDYTPVNGTATFAAGQTSSWLRIQVFGDTLNEGNETFDLVLTDIVGAVFENNASALVATGTIVNDDGGAPTLTGGIGGAGDGVFGPASASAVLPTMRIQDVRHIEGNTSWDYAYFLVTLDEAPTAPVSVNVYIQDGTASTRQGDYTAYTDTLTFAAGQTSSWVRVQVFGDTLIEQNETFDIVLTDITGAVFEGGASAISATATIVNDDGGAPTLAGGIGVAGDGIFGPVSASASLPTLRVQDVRHIEGNVSSDYAYFLVTLDQAPTAPVSVNFYLQDGTASTLRGDYSSGTGTLNFAAGQTSSWVRVLVSGDALIEQNETFDIVFTDIVGAVFEGGASAIAATATIVNDDSGALTDSGGIGGAPDLYYGAGPASGNLPAISIHNVAHNEGNVSSDFAYFLVTLDRAPTVPTSVRFHTNDGSASTAQGDYSDGDGVLNFDAGQTSSWIRVTVFGDTRVEANEALTLTLTDPSNAVFAANASALVATATIVEDDAGAPTLAGGIGDFGAPVLSPGGYSATLPTLTVWDVSQYEGNASSNFAYFLVTLDRPAPSAISFSYFAQDGTASGASGDYADGFGTVNIAAGDTSTWLRIQVNGDTLIEQNETFQLVLSNLVGAVFPDNAPALVATGTIIEDDAGTPTLTGGLGRQGLGVAPPADTNVLPRIRVVSTSVNEGNVGQTALPGVYLLLSHASTVPITFNIASVAGTATTGVDYQAFAQNGVQIPAGVTSVFLQPSVFGDVAIESDEAFTVLFSNLAGAVWESGAASASATVLIRDNDGGGSAGSQSGPAFDFIRQLDGNDLIIGSPQADIRYGYGGDDTMFGNAGDDILDGGDGNDTIDGGAGSDKLIGGAGVDTASYATATSGVTVSLAIAGAQNTVGAGLDTLIGIENLTGSAFSDNLTGDAANNTLSGGAGVDTLIGGAGDDVLIGGDNTDFIVDLSGVVSIDGGAGNEQITLGAGVVSGTVDGGLGTDQVTKGGSIAGLTFVSVEILNTNGGIVTGSAAQFESFDTIRFSAGQPSTAISLVLSAAGTVDLADELLGRRVIFTGTAGNDTITTSNGSDNIDGGAGDDVLSGGLGVDTLIGGLGNDILNGGDGIDFIVDLSGIMAIDAGDGDDVMTVGAAVSAGTIAGGLGTDQLNKGGAINGLTITGIEIVNTNGGTLLATAAQFESFDTIRFSAALATTAVSLALADAGTVDLTDELLGRRALFAGSSGNDVITTSNGSDQIDGGDGNDVLSGGAGVDTLIGGLGDDVLNGGDGGDFIVDLSGVVAIDGGDGDDVITVGAAVSSGTIAGGLGTNDQLNKGGAISGITISGIEIINTNGGTLTATAAQLESFDTIRFSAALPTTRVNLALAAAGTVDLTDELLGGRALITGSSGADVITTSDGADTLLGGGGNDTLNGGAGDDLIVQGSGDGRDIIDGAAGTDTYQLNGTAAAETFRIMTRAEALLAGITGLAGATEIVITKDGTDNASVIAELDNVEEILINTLLTTANNGNGTVDGGTNAGDTIIVLGDFTTTSLAYSTIHVAGSNANDTVDISGLTSAHRVVFDANGGADAFVGEVRPQDVVTGIPGISANFLSTAGIASDFQLMELVNQTSLSAASDRVDPFVLLQSGHEMTAVDLASPADLLLSARDLLTGFDTKDLGSHQIAADYALV